MNVLAEGDGRAGGLLVSSDIDFGRGEHRRLGRGIEDREVGKTRTGLQRSCSSGTGKAKADRNVHCRRRRARDFYSWGDEAMK